MAAAGAASKKVIGVDVDQSAESKTVITSAMKMLGTSVYDALVEYYAGKFKGGVSTTLDAKVGGIGLSKDFSRFTTFKKADYDMIFAKLVADTDKIASNIKKDTDGTTKIALTGLGTTLVKITEIK